MELMKLISNPAVPFHINVALLPRVIIIYLAKMCHIRLAASKAHPTINFKQTNNVINVVILKNYLFGEVKIGINRKDLFPISFRALLLSAYKFSCIIIPNP